VTRHPSDALPPSPTTTTTTKHKTDSLFPENGFSENYYISQSDTPSAAFFSSSFITRFREWAFSLRTRIEITVVTRRTGAAGNITGNLSSVWNPDWLIEPREINLSDDVESQKRLIKAPLVSVALACRLSTPDPHTRFCPSPDLREHLVNRLLLGTFYRGWAIFFVFGSAVLDPSLATPSPSGRKDKRPSGVCLLFGGNCYSRRSLHRTNDCSNQGAFIRVAVMGLCRLFSCSVYRAINTGGKCRNL